MTFYSKVDQGSDPAKGPETMPSCWSLPSLLVPSFNGASPNPLVLHERVAEALGVDEGDSIVFSLRDQNRYDYCEANKQACSWTQDANMFSLPISIADDSAPFDVAIESNSDRTCHIFDGTMHNPLGNFLLLTNGSMLKLNEQERVYRGLKTSKDLRCCGMMLEVEGLTDYYNHNHGAGCGFCIYASTPLVNPKPSEQMVQGYRYLGDTNNAQEAIYYGLLEALVWVFRLDFQTVWIVGSAQPVFRELLDGKNNDNSPLVKQVRHLLDRARQLRIQLKFLGSDETALSMDLATRAIVQRRNETWCHWSTINYQSQRNLPINKSLARQVSI